MEQILLLDDDLKFAHRLAGLSLKAGINTDQAQSLLELGSFAALQNYKLVVVREQLPAMRALEVAQYVEAFFPQIPVIVITNSECANLRKRKDFPRCVSALITKNLGEKVLLQTVLDVLYENNRPEKQSSTPVFAPDDKRT